MAVKEGLPATDFSRMNREWVKAVAEGGSGGGGLPEITESDEGKFLGVVSGEAAWATAGGGGGFYVINENITTHVLDKTFMEIYNAYTGGYICVIKQYYEASEEYPALWNFENVVSIRRDLNMQGEGEGGVIGTSGGTNYDALTDNAYPSMRQ